IPVNRGYVVPSVTDIVPTHPATFEEVRTRVTADAKAEKGRQIATDKGNQAQELVKAGKDLQTVAKTVGADVKTSEMIGRGSTLPDFGTIQGFEDDMFSLALGKTAKPITVGGKTLVFAVKDRQEPSQEDMKKSTDTLKNELLAEKRERYFGEYI